MKYIFSIYLILLFALPSYSQEEVIFKVKFKEGFEAIEKAQSESQIKNILSKMNNGKLKKSFPNAENSALLNTYDLYFIGDADSIKSKLLMNPNIKLVTEYKIAYPLISCTEPIPVNDYYVNNTNGAYQIGLSEFDCAWKLSEGNSQTIIGFADTEFMTNHEDNIGQIVHIEGPISNYHPHGTFTTGIAIALTNNTIGLAGAGNKSKAACYRIQHNPSGSANQVDIKDAVWSAYLDGRSVINVSWTSTGLSQSEAEVITENGTVIVTAAGNDSTDNNHSTIANVPGVINVSGVNIDNESWPVDNARNQWVDLCAASAALITTNPPTNTPSWTYLTVWGTSVAAPQVAATVALMQDVNKCLSPGEIETTMEQACDPIADGYRFPGQLGAGKLNAYKSLQGAIDAGTVFMDNMTLTGPTFITGLYISSANTILAENAFVIYQAEDYIILDSGFEVELGSTFETQNIVYQCP
jgi:hypothetical protein